MTRWLALLLFTMSAAASAVVIRGDVDDAAYRIAPSALPALVDLPGEGHGVLVAPQWVVTAAHAVAGPHGPARVVIDGRTVAVDRIVFHPGYAGLPPALVEQALATGDATLVLVFLASHDDLALLRLTQPVPGVAPLALDRSGDEVGREVTIVGKGATGTGEQGHDQQGPNRTALRRATNRISSADGRWLCYVFDPPATALPLEGAMGNGDSGGPVLVRVGDDWQLAGVASWKLVAGHVASARSGRYGQPACNVRLRHYADWIDRIVAEDGAQDAAAPADVSEPRP